MMDLRDVLAIASFAVSLVVFAIGMLVNYFALIMPIKTDVAVIKTQIEPVWKYVIESVARSLHSPHTPVLDHYLDMLVEGKLKRKEDLCAFKVELERVIADEVDPSRKTGLVFFYEFVSSQLKILQLQAHVWPSHRSDRRSQCT